MGAINYVFQAKEAGKNIRKKGEIRKRRPLLRSAWRRIAADNIDVQHAARNGIPEKRRSRENRFERVYTHLGAGKRTTAEKLAAV